MARIIYDGPTNLKANQLFKCIISIFIEEELSKGAINGCRPALVLKAGDAIMGDKIEMPMGSILRFEFHAVTDGFFDHAELICQTTAIARFSKNENQITEIKDGYDVVVEYGKKAYYLRLYQTDGGIAWTSPIYVTGI